MTRPLLQVQGLHAQYGPTRVLHGIDFEVREGGITTILGANGAGKTTTLQTISGLLRPSAGEVRFEGEAASQVKAHQLVKKGISQAPEGRRIFGTLTVRENLDLGAFTRTDQDEIAASKQWIYTLFPVLAQRQDQLAMPKSSMAAFTASLAPPITV